MAKPFKLTAPRALEHQEQAALFQWAAVEARRDPRLKLLNASQNGLPASSIQQAVLAKKCGMKKGYPDVFLPVAARGWHGLFIELKRKGGVPSDVSEDQHWWIWNLLEQDYQAVVCFGWEQAVAQIQAYLRRDSSDGRAVVVAGSSPAPGFNHPGFLGGRREQATPAGSIPAMGPTKNPLLGMKPEAGHCAGDSRLITDDNREKHQ